MPIKKNRSGLYGKMLVVLCIIAIVIYTYVIVKNYLETGKEPTIITIAFYFFFGSELGFLATKRILCGKKAASSYVPSGGAFGGGGYGSYGGRMDYSSDFPMDALDSDDGGFSEAVETVTENITE